MDHRTKAKIDALLVELRAWDPREDPRHALATLARMFGLDPLIVERLAQSENIKFDKTPLPLVDPNAETQPRAERPAVYWSSRLRRYISLEDPEWSEEEFKRSLK